MAARQGPGTSRTFFVPAHLQDGTLEIEVRYAKNLKNTDFFKNSDPYCSIEIEGKNFTTDILWGAGVNPIWNYSTGPVEIWTTTDKVRFVIKDKDRFTEDDVMGNTELDLAEVRRSGYISTELTVLRPNGKKKGTLAVTARYARNLPATVAPAPLDSLDSVDLPASSGRPGFGRVTHRLDSKLRKTGVMSIQDLMIDPEEVMLRESRKALSEFQQELSVVEGKVDVLKNERNNLLLSCPPGTSAVEHIQKHADEFMDIDDKMKSLLKQQDTLKYGINELRGMERLVKEHQLLEPEIFLPLQQYILTGVTSEVARLAEDDSAPAESVVGQVQAALKKQAYQLQHADSLKRIDMWRLMLSDLEEQRVRAAAAAVAMQPHSTGGAGASSTSTQEQDMDLRSSLWGKAKVAANPAPPPPPPALQPAQQNMISGLESMLSMLKNPGALAALQAASAYTPNPPPIRTSYSDDLPPPPPPDDDEEPPSPPSPPPDDDFPHTSYVDPYQTAAPPPPPPPPPGRAGVVLEGENVGPKAPPAPPPFGMGGGKKPAGREGVMRTTELSDLLSDLKHAMMGTEAKKVVIAGGGKSNLIAELEKRSPFHQKVKDEIQTYGYLVEKVGKDVNEFSCHDMESAVIFMKGIDQQLSVMEHEVEVLNHYSSIFPTQRYYTIREGAYLYDDLRKLRHRISIWDAAGAKPLDAIGRIDQFYNKLVWQIDRFLNSQEEITKRFKSEGLPWDNIYVQNVQHDALKLVILYMDLTLQEVASLESRLPPCPELTNSALQLCINAVHFGVKGHQFAGGIDPNTTVKFKELALVSQKYAELKKQDKAAAQ